MASQNLTDAIHNAIKARIRDTLMPKVTYDNATGNRTTAAIGTVKAKSAFVQPVQTTFEGSTNFSEWMRMRDGWEWLAEIKFSVAVDLEAFEDDLAHNPIKISRSESGQDRQVLIALVDVVYQIPPTGQPASGTRASLRLTAVLSPM